MHFLMVLKLLGERVYTFCVLMNYVHILFQKVKAIYIPTNGAKELGAKIKIDKTESLSGS